MNYCLVFTRNKAILETIWSYRVYKGLFMLTKLMTELYCLLYMQYKYTYVSVDPLVRDDA